MRFRRTTPPPAAPERAADAAAQAELARYSTEDGDEGASQHRQNKAVRAARGLRVKPRDEPDADED
ncbi:hypothetical protein ACFVYP_07150 [Kitasatospora sp. NPDC058201]|uniref:hypothetical protein n=1 Tax=unclassified Kitasatospora TaxID=2633591 RepID=UPI003650B440